MVLSMAVVGCTDQARVPLAPGEVLLAKGGGGGPSVSATTPSYGYQGDVAKQVTITGSGFASGAVAAWERSGVSDPKVIVLATQYVSSTQLVATITIAPDADISLYDVSVTNTDRKKGIGTAMFEVTTADVIGSLGGESVVWDMNDLGDIVGSCGGNGACTGAFVYENGVALKAIGTGQARAADPSGTMAVGRNGNGKAVAWIRQGDGSYVEQLLPNPGGGGGAVQGAARDGSGALIVGGFDAVRTSRNVTSNRPAVWTRTGSTWSAPVLYASPGSSANIRDLNAAGQAVGQSDATPGGVAWESATSYVVLDGLPLAMNDAGTVAVGWSTNGPVFWVRNALTNAWNSTGILLPHVSACSGAGVPQANDVNDDGVIVGQSCSGSNRVATVWRLDMSGATPALAGGAVALPGLGGSGSERSTASAVSRTAPYAVAGVAKGVVVRWALP